MMNCPCGSGTSYSDCCQPFHTKAKNAPTAELLMRSRYSAFVLGNEEYLLYSWAPETAPHSLNLEEFIMWRGLTIHQSYHGGLLTRRGLSNSLLGMLSVDNCNHNMKRPISDAMMGAGSMLTEIFIRNISKC